MLERSERALADSMRARMFRGGGKWGVGVGVVGCRDGRVWRITSVMKWRSEGEFTLGTTMVSRFGALS